MGKASQDFGPLEQSTNIEAWQTMNMELFERVHMKKLHCIFYIRQVGNG